MNPFLGYSLSIARKSREILGKSSDCEKRFNFGNITEANFPTIMFLIISILVLTIGLIIFPSKRIKFVFSNRDDINMMIAIWGQTFRILEMSLVRDGFDLKLSSMIMTSRVDKSVKNS